MKINLNKLINSAIDFTPKLAGAILIIIVGFLFAKFVKTKTTKFLENKEIDPTLKPFIFSFLDLLIKGLVLLSAATMIGFKVTSFIAIFSAISFAIGMALQGNLSHMAAGILILFFKPFKVGDFIVTQGYSGTVKSIEIFNTIITTLDNRVIIIPNGIITANPLENLTTNATRKVPLTFGISYGDNIDKAREIIKKVADSCPYILKNLEVDILVDELADSSVNFTVRPWCKTEDYWNVHFFMQENIKKAFDKEGISIPFPQMNVHKMS